ncbi:MAG: CRISPR-associated helicase Cas3' [Candidatus Bathyarchaeia archaeon]
MEIDDAYNYVISNLTRKVSDRPGMLETVKEVCKGKNVVLSAPPGYGKTNIPYTLAYLSSKSLGPWAPHTIHILPLRSIIEDVYRRLFSEDGRPLIKELNRHRVAKQMLGSSESPYLQKSLVLTTIDTYLLSAIRVPPGDHIKIGRGVSMGHGEYTRAALLASNSVFDEVQLLLEEGGKLTAAFISIIKFLSYTKTPFIIMSATVPNRLSEFLINYGIEFKLLKYGVDFKSPEFESIEISKRVGFHRETLDSREEYISTVVKHVKEFASAEKILVVSNTVKKTVEIAKRLEMDLGEKPIVLHSKVIAKDRRSRLEKIAKTNNWIITSTQVVEAGMDISARALITEAATPSAIIQRAGRLLRKNEEEGEMVILYDESEIHEGGYYSVYPLNLVNSAHSILGEIGKDIQWHIPIVESENKIGYEEFLEKAYEEAEFEISFDKEISDRIGKMMFLLNVSPKDTLRVLEDYGSLTREQPLILGIVDYKDFFKQNQEYESDDEEIEQFFNEYSFPLTIIDVITLIKNNCLILKLHDSKLFCLNSKNVIRRFSVGELRDVIAFIIPMEFYDNSYGFIGAFS